MKLLLIGTAVIVALAVAGDRVQLVKSDVNPAVDPAGVEANDTHASASLLGQFRTSAATWLYLHADLYLHNGVEMRPLLKSEKDRGKQGDAAGDDKLGAGEGSNETTVIPGVEQDFRGWIGDMERATGAYKDMRAHKHNPPETAIPLFRLMTVIDPTFVPGWTLGAMIIARDVKTGPDRAIQFLLQGVKENPREFRLRYQVGFYLAAYDRKLEQALPWLESARQLSLNRTDFSDQEADDLTNNYRWQALCLRDLKRPSDEGAILAEGLRRFPKDPMLMRMQHKLAVSLPGPHGDPE